MNTTSKKIIGEINIFGPLFLEINQNISSISSAVESLERFFSKNTSEMLEAIMSAGIVLGVSDIHLEPEELEVKLRMRVDGLLHNVSKINPASYKSILSRIKLLSGLKLNINETAQDGRFSVSYPLVKIEERNKMVLDIEKREEVEVRVSTLPSEYGETTVLRILNPKKLVEIAQLGLRKDLRESFEKEIQRPNGMIIVTGPTGSGKTTTLYAILKKINQPEIKIITIEDPVEYHLDGISQTEVHPDKDYTFANGLRAIVRQDPDVILVGEIRDLETAEIAIQAALTGHLVLSTLHTNDATGVIARLQSLGEKPYNIAPALNIVIAQRLIRKVCSFCSKKEKMSNEEYEKINKALKNVSKDIISYSRDSEIVRTVGCEKCHQTGYKGRVGIFEVLKVGPEMEKLIISSPSSFEIKEKALKSGMLTIYQDGIIKVLINETTIEEIERVAFEE